MEIEDPVKKAVEKVYFKIRHNGKDNNNGVGSSTNSVATCHKCGKKSHMKISLNPIEIILMVDYPNDQQEIFQNWSPRSL